MSFRILVIEDESFWCEQFQDVLEAMGFIADSTDKLGAAEAKLKEKEYRLVLLDAALDLDSLPQAVEEFIKSLHQQYPDLPLVAATGKDLKPPEVARLFELGIDSFVYKKELEVLDFQQRIWNVLSKRTWNLAKIRRLLTDAFSDQELTNLCFDYFGLVYNNFSAGMDKAQKIQLLLSHCARFGELDKLLKLAREHNPHQYARFTRM
jgi:CheY-like chemotaxis protein